MKDCRHKPPCGDQATTWVCGQRTLLEHAVSRGLVNRSGAQELLRKYGVPMTAQSRVYTGQETVKVGAGQERLL